MTVSLHSRKRSKCVRRRTPKLSQIQLIIKKEKRKKKKKKEKNNVSLILVFMGSI